MNKIINNKIYSKFFKILISNLFFLFFLINQNAISKPVPPGSGEGDVPANILILLDSSASMSNNNVQGGDGLDHPKSLAVDSNGNLYIGEGKNGVMKMKPDATADANFADNNRNFKGTGGDTTCVIGAGPSGGSNTTLRNVESMAISSNDVIYAMGGTNDGKVIGIDTDGKCVDGSMQHSVIRQRPAAITIQQIDGKDHLWVAGRVFQSGWKTSLFTKNLTDGVTHLCVNKARSNHSDITRVLYATKSIAVSKDGDWLYFANGNNIEGYPLAKANNDNNYCPSLWTKQRSYAHDNSAIDKHGRAARIAMSKDENNVMYVTSHRHYVQKLTLSDSGVTRVAIAGKHSITSHKATTAGTLAANMVSTIKPTAIAVTSSGIYVGDNNNRIQEYDEDLFGKDMTVYTTVSTAHNTSWQKEYGGKKDNRYVGAKNAIKAIVADSALTSGANFGYGHWNSGEIGSGNKRNPGQKGGWECHNLYDDCVYYGSWNGDHPEGTSSQCNSDSCLLVGVGENTADDIPAALDLYYTEWGTDGNAYAQLADKYFREPSPVDPSEYLLVDEDSECQLNYIVVIGDGAQKHHAQAMNVIRQLREDLGVKTIVVAYGGGITGNPLKQFKDLAIAGSCNAAGDDDCHELIEADTPERLKTELQSKIRQIIAERLSFTAPSITATLQKGGDIFQAQFNYEQHGEWQGTILRKELLADGSVCHEADPAKCPGNWDAGQLLKDKGSSTRNIWSAINGVNYYNNWNNWDPANHTDIDLLFQLTGVEVGDYHHALSNCGKKNTPNIEDGNADDIKGLINFVRGVDYFDYNGNCDITEDRDWLLGDIYHSQLIEVESPNAKTDFTNINQEAYWRKKNNYNGFKSSYATRQHVIYAGGNDGMLHAFNADTGEEMWGFVPPFIAAKLPLIVQRDLDGFVGAHDGGGTNPIFAVDGSPVVHDMYIHGLDFASATKYEEAKSWRTILFIPYGRGGPGFTVLDVTEPLIKPGKGPMHMFSIFNDAINNQVLVSDHQGVITTHSYQITSVNISNSQEAKQAESNQTTARNADPDDCDSTDTDTTNDCTQQDAIQACQSNSDATSGVFRVDGTAACFKDKKWTWNSIILPTNAAGEVNKEDLIVTELKDGDTSKRITIDTAKMVNGNLEITFNEEKTYSKAASSLVESSRQSSRIIIATSCDSGGTTNKKYDYSQLGETWSTPRIFRMPAATGDSNLDNDTYVAVMGGGMGVNTLCVGSSLFVIDLENNDVEPGSLFTPDGPIKIVDTDPAGTNPGANDNVATPNGSDISNATPASPMVITPDNAKNVPWRGAMVYFNDLEGKITKFNLTSSTKNSAKLYDQTTLYNLNANKRNGRFSFFEMDVTIGSDTNNLWLFGSTGNFNRISSTGNKNGDWMQNILYGIRDPHFPYFKHLNGIEVPLYNEAGFTESAAIGANVAPNIDNNDTVDLTGGNQDVSQSLAHGAAKNCKNTTDVTSGCVVSHIDNAWVIYLDEPDGKPIKETSNRFRKASAAPTVFKGHVYFPIYEPDKEDECGLGKAFICSADDECGTNISRYIDKDNFVDSDDCHYVKRGILSKLAVGVGDSLFGNVAGPSDNEETLIKILSSSTDVSTYRRSWRENF